MPAEIAIALALGLAVAQGFAGQTQAASFPDHPVKIVVPFPAGGTADAVPRILLNGCRANGASPWSSKITPAQAAISAPSWSLNPLPMATRCCRAPPPPLVVNQNLYPNLAFDPAKFEPILVTAQVPNALLVNPNKLKATTLPELIDYLKQHPDTVTAATQGNGTTSHLTTELFNLKAKVKIRNIPYRGSAPALQGLLVGNVDMMFDNFGVSLALVKSGKLRLLAVASAQRLTSLPDVPTMSEELPGFKSVAW